MLHPDAAGGKRSLSGRSGSEARAKAFAAEAFAAFGTSDYQKGYRAFLEKRTPEFEGR